MSFLNVLAFAVGSLVGMGGVEPPTCDNCEAVNTLIKVDGVTKCENCGTVFDEEGNVSTDLSAINWDRHL